MNEPIKAITLYQPWASLIAWGVKRVETRSWGTSYRGKLIIHAGVSLDGLRALGATQMFGGADDDRLFLNIARHEARAHGFLSAFDFPRGCAVCMVDLEDCQIMSDANIPGYSDDERACGLWVPGRFIWKLGNVRLLDPIPCRGHQQLWRWSLPLPEGI